MLFIAAGLLLVATLATGLLLAHERKQRRAQAEQAEHQARVQRGQALFHGEAALPGHLSGHAQALPTLATRCVNCHAAPGQAVDGPSLLSALAAAPPGAGPALAETTAASPPIADRIGPPLSRTRLTEARPRRGGPASRFDAHSLCQALTSGVDPAQVLLPDRMPRYQPSPEQCQDLWAYLVSQ
jgi:hypothetical protein